MTVFNVSYHILFLSAYSCWFFYFHTPVTFPHCRTSSLPTLLVCLEMCVLFLKFVCLSILLFSWVLTAYLSWFCHIFCSISSLSDLLLANTLFSQFFAILFQSYSPLPTFEITLFPQGFFPIFFNHTIGRSF